MTISLTELVGYLASFTVLISFVMKEIKTLRIINTMGCALFVVYGILLNYSIPIILTNVSIMGINTYFILKARNPQK